MSARVEVNQPQPDALIGWRQLAAGLLAGVARHHRWRVKRKHHGQALRPNRPSTRDNRPEGSGT